VPTELLKYATVWSALLEKMPMTAMIRNLGNLSKCGLLTPLSDTEKEVARRVNDEAALKKSRVHPIQILLAEKVYESGKGVRGSGEWKVAPKVVEALDTAFYLSFMNVEPTGKNFYLAVDVSSSMSGGQIAGAPGLTPCAGAAAMAMTTVHAEENYYVSGFAEKMKEITVTKQDKLTTVMQKFQDRNFGGTDTSAAILDAQNRKMKVDAFVLYTDGMTWAGDTHTCKALENYRQKMSVPARLIVCNMVSSDVTVADPTDGGSLDVVGFDAATPQIISSFASGLM
jgi:60 kDa SS-A/Ro ribonucleoprotein